MIKVDIISGFLGAGKTTLINKLLSEAYMGEQPVLIENEFGQVGIDQSLIENPDIQVRLLPSGCICCTLKSDFIQGITEVIGKYQPSRIIVEPTGLANPRDVLEACAMAANQAPLAANAHLTVVNAQNILPLLKIGGELFRDQIAEAELLVLSRTQLLSEKALSEVNGTLRSLNPRCPILAKDFKQLDGLKLLTLAEAVHRQHAEPSCQCKHPHEGPCAHSHDASHHHHHGAGEYEALAFFPDRSYSRQQLEALLEVFSREDNGQILRAKGFLKAPDGRFIRLEYVYGHGHIAETAYSGEPKLVVIGSNLREKAIGELLEGV